MISTFVFLTPLLIGVLCCGLMRPLAFPPHPELSGSCLAFQIAKELQFQIAEWLACCLLRKSLSSSLELSLWEHEKRACAVVQETGYHPPVMLDLNISFSFVYLSFSFHLFLKHVQQFEGDDFISVSPNPGAAVPHCPSP